jgi:hypothetical protein
MKTRDEYIYELQGKFKSLDRRLWERKTNWSLVEKWYTQFRTHVNVEDDEQIQMLFLASHFMYFGQSEVRALLKSLFRDLYQYKIIENIRRRNNDTVDRSVIAAEYEKALSRTRFVGIGGPSESGPFLLYPFRQENNLSVSHFTESQRILARYGWKGLFQPKLVDPDIDHYVFIDDLCGSGTQAEQYSKKILRHLKRLKPAAKVYYFPLVATEFGLSEVRKLKRFDEVAAVLELDESFKCFSPSSRIYKNEQEPFDLAKAKAISNEYGRRLWTKNPLGYKDGQLLLGFNHNTPDNTLPIMWFGEPGSGWTPLFKRSHKK